MTAAILIFAIGLVVGRRIARRATGRRELAGATFIDARCVEVRRC